jgi:hypothetical protein
MKKRVIKATIIVFVLGIALWILLPLCRPEYSGINFNPANSQNVTDKTIMNWESGETDMNATTFMRLCELYQFNPSDIFLPKSLT